MTHSAPQRPPLCTAHRGCKNTDSKPVRLSNFAFATTIKNAWVAPLCESGGEGSWFRGSFEVVKQRVGWPFRFQRYFRLRISQGEGSQAKKCGWEWGGK